MQPCCGQALTPTQARQENTVRSSPHLAMHLVLTGIFPQGLGKALNRAESIRLLADYTGEDIDSQQAHSIVIEAENFVSAVKNKYKTGV